MKRVSNTKVPGHYTDQAIFSNFVHFRIDPK